jgi:hypothetical protein
MHFFLASHYWGINHLGSCLIGSIKALPERHKDDISPYQIGLPASPLAQQTQPVTLILKLQKEGSPRENLGP